MLFPGSMLDPSYYGYFPESSTLGCPPHNFKQLKVEFAGLNFQLETGSRYLGR